MSDEASEDMRDGNGQSQRAEKLTKTNRSAAFRKACLELGGSDLSIWVFFFFPPCMNVGDQRV